MEPPYHLLVTIGDYLFAAKGGDLHSFNLRDGSFRCSWQHPSKGSLQSGNLEAASEGSSLVKGVPQDGAVGAEATEEPRATKRRRLSGDGVAETQARDTRPLLDEEHSQRSWSPSKRQVGRPSKMATQDRALITSLIASPDGRHLVTATGLDKTLRVFAADQSEPLKLLSERILAKRLCSIAFTTDGQTILAADKFGDVFAFPLQAPDEAEESASDAREAAIVQSPAPSRPFKPEADLSTVHSKKNLQALANQLRAANNNQPRFKQYAPQHVPILGHVSMLTSVVTAQERKGRPYIITADRDEHIRVSRGLPQAHVIETYCLGHTQFVSRLCIPPNRPDLLVSGGGDDELFLWDWRAGRVLSTLNLLEHVMKVKSDSANIAVYGIHASTAASVDSKGSSLFVICERVPAVFVVELDDASKLQFSHTIFLDAIPLDLTSAASSATNEQYLIALDVSAVQNQGTEDVGVRRGIISMIRDNNSADKHFKVEPFMLGASYSEENPFNWTREEIEGHLYTVESMRKTLGEEPQDAET